MSHSIADLLAKKDFDEPPEVGVIKKFLQDTYKVDCAITMQPRQIIIEVVGASLAGALRTRLHELQELCQTDKRLVIRIRG